MRVEALTNDRLADFVDYCKRHKAEVDESYLYDEDLRNFKPDEENPTYIAVDENGKVVAAASLIINDYMRRGKKGRFRIFHTEIDDMASMRELLKAILSHTEGLNMISLFIPIVNRKLIEVMEKLDFYIERYSFLLVREDMEVSDISLLKGYEIRPFRSGIDEESWCQIRNTSFAKLLGNETPITPKMVEEMRLSDDYIDGGMMILYHGETPVGVIRGSKDEYEDQPIMNIGPVAVNPEYQGRGLGRSLLRAVLAFAREKGYKRTVLAVNAENERAKTLYIQEGFRQVEAVVSYKYELRGKHEI